MKRAERRPGDDEVVDRVRRPYRREHLFYQIPLVREMAAGSVLRLHALVVERLAVHRIHAPELQPPGIDPRRHVPDQSEVFPLIETPHRRREDEHRRPLIAEDEKLHVPAERGTPPLLVVAIHPFLARAWASSMSCQATSASRQSRTSDGFAASSSYFWREPRGISTRTSTLGGRLPLPNLALSRIFCRRDDHGDLAFRPFGSIASGEF